MRSVKEIVEKMNLTHLQIVREELSADEGYNKFTLAILDNYQANQGEDVLLEKLNINLQSLRLFERTIEKAIFDFYGLEAKSVQELLISSVFYAIYGQTKKQAHIKRAELESLFCSMKQFGIDQIASPLVNELYLANLGTTTEAAYFQLNENYKKVLDDTNMILDKFSSFNTTLAEFLESNKKSLSNKLVSQHDEIRQIYQNTKNKTTKVVYYLSKLICVAYADQTIVLENGKIGLGEVLTITYEGLFQLPFGIDRFYLKNVFAHVYAKHLSNVEKPEIGQIILGKETESNLFGAYNFNFPNEVSRDLVMFMQLPKTHSEKINIQLETGSLDQSFNGGFPELLFPKVSIYKSLLN
ncbi:MAG: hypothetical protein KDB74_03315 [Flavobacteriales bacterium]|nr:hypothetical protein [Flavobacteriales bacterium]